MKHPIFKTNPPHQFWLAMLAIYITGGIIACGVAYLTRDWR